MALIALAAVALLAVPAAAIALEQRCCLRVEASALGTIGADFGSDPTTYYSGRRDWAWSARIRALYLWEGNRNDWSLHGATRSDLQRGKFGYSAFGDVASNYRSPSPPNYQAGEPDVYRCNVHVSTSRRWIKAPEFDTDFVNSHSGNELEVLFPEHQLLPSWGGAHSDSPQPGFAAEGDCEEGVWSHRGQAYAEGLAVSQMEVKAPEALRAAKMPSVEAIKKASPFEAKTTDAEAPYPPWTIGHPATGNPTQGFPYYESTAGRSRLKYVRFEFFPKSDLEKEKKKLKALPMAP